MSGTRRNLSQLQGTNDSLLPNAPRSPAPVWGATVPSLPVQSHHSMPTQGRHSTTNPNISTSSNLQISAAVRPPTAIRPQGSTIAPLYRPVQSHLPIPIPSSQNQGYYRDQGTPKHPISLRPRSMLAGRTAATASVPQSIPRLHPHAIQHSQQSTANARDIPLSLRPGQASAAPVLASPNSYLDTPQNALPTLATYRGMSKYGHTQVTGRSTKSPPQTYSEPDPREPLPCAARLLFPMKVYVGDDAKVLTGPWWDSDKKFPLSGSRAWLIEEERLARRKERVHARRDLKRYGAPEWLAQVSEDDEDY